MGRGKAKKQKSKNGQDRWIEVSKEGLKDGSGEEEKLCKKTEV